MSIRFGYPSQIGVLSGMTGLLIATLGTDAIGETATLRIALVLILAGIVGIGGPVLIGLRRAIGDRGQPEVPTDG